MATVVNVSKRPASKGPDWARRYPPLITIGLAVVLAAVVLPSALNQPQANPTSTPELAPVTGQSSDAPQGNLASLGLGRSSGIEGSGALGDGGGVDDDLPPAGEGVGGRGKTLQTKRCVGKPPRQTEDPLSPPCVASFDGDNGGKTYQGVTSDEIRIVMYWDGGSVNFPTARGADPPRSSTSTTRPPTTRPASRSSPGSGPGTSRSVTRPTDGDRTSTSTGAAPSPTRPRRARPTPPTSTARSSPSPRSPTPGSVARVRSTSSSWRRRACSTSALPPAGPTRSSSSSRN